MSNVTSLPTHSYGTVGERAANRAARVALAPRSATQPPAEASPETARLSAAGLVKSYRKARLEIPVLRGVNFEAQPGEFVAIVGQSGSGKSTLLHLLATLDHADSGQIYFDGYRIDHLPATNQDKIRNRHFGMIFQAYHLLPELSMLENVLAPLAIRYSLVGYYMRRRALVEKAKAALEQVGLAHRMKHKPRELSGGEMQRTAIARALISDPDVLLADEPTGNLDSKTGREIMDLLRWLNQEQNLTIVMVTHDNALAAESDRVVRLAEGLVESVR
jgi:lipoprotein-releasing system ATP-binding protein